MFFTVTLPVTLWFLDKGKHNGPRADEVLFIDAREIYNTVDRAHRDWTTQQVEFLANIVRLWRGEEPEFEQGSREMTDERFADGTYADVPGLCGIATYIDIEKQSWSLNPGRYVPIKLEVLSDEDFDERRTELAGEFAELSRAARSFEVLVNNQLEFK